MRRARARDAGALGARQARSGSARRFTSCARSTRAAGCCSIRSPGSARCDASPFLDQLRTLIWKDACIDIRYERSNGEHRDYRVEPYALVVKVDTWYLIGRVKREMRVFRISRIQSLTPTGETFARDADFDLQKFWKRWCERFETNPPPRNFAVELNITRARPPAPAGCVRLAGCGGALEPLGDRFRGRKPVTLEFDREDIAMRILFEVGPEAEIVKPVSLRRKLRRQAAKIVGAAPGTDQQIPISL